MWINQLHPKKWKLNHLDYINPQKSLHVLIYSAYRFLFEPGDVLKMFLAFKQFEPGRSYIKKRVYSFMTATKVLTSNCETFISECIFY